MTFAQGQGPEGIEPGAPSIRRTHGLPDITFRLGCSDRRRRRPSDTRHAVRPNVALSQSPPSCDQCGPGGQKESSVIDSYYIGPCTGFKFPFFSQRACSTTSLAKSRLLFQRFRRQSRVVLRNLYRKPPARYRSERQNVQPVFRDAT